MMKQKRFLLAGILTGVLLAFSGCGGPTGADGGATPTNNPPASQTSANTDAGTQAPTNPVPDTSTTGGGEPAATCTGATLSFGDTCQDTNGVRFTVDTPMAFTPSPSVMAAYGGGSDQAAKFTVTVDNESGYPWLSAALGGLTCFSPTSGAPVVDAAQGVTDTSGSDADTANVPAGQTQTYTLGCWVTGSGSLQVELDAVDILSPPRWQ